MYVVEVSRVVLLDKSEVAYNNQFLHKQSFCALNVTLLRRFYFETTCRCSASVGENRRAEGGLQEAGGY